MTQHKHFDLDTLTQLHSRPRQVDRTGWSSQANTFFSCACYARSALLATLHQLEKPYEERYGKEKDEELIRKAKSHMKDWKQFDHRLMIELDIIKRKGKESSKI